MNIFVEGVQGSGKSTLLNHFEKNYTNYKVYREGDYSPVELAWCSYLSENQYHECLEKFNYYPEIIDNSHKENDKYVVTYTKIRAEGAFYQYMEQYEIYNARVSYDEFKSIIYSRYRNFNGDNNIFECSFLQNITENLILFYLKTDDEIVEFYRELYSLINQEQFKLIYLYSDQIEENVLLAKKERIDENGNEIWFSLMMDYLSNCPYGQANNANDVDALVKHLTHRRDLEIRIVNEILGDKGIIIQAKKYDFNRLINEL